MAVLDGAARGATLFALLAPGLWFSLASSRARLAAHGARRREREAGYTTEYARRGGDLWHLDPDTGAVLRRPGDPLITRADARRIREGSYRLPPGGTGGLADEGGRGRARVTGGELSWAARPPAPDGPAAGSLDMG